MKLSVIITSWNTCDLLRRCLRSIQAYPPEQPHEVIVVDNASHDGSADMVEREFPSVRLVRNSHNRGYAGGNNQGIKIAKGEYLLLLGSDTEVGKCALQTMIAFLDDHPEAAAVSCRLLQPDGSLQRSCRRFPTLANALATYSSLHFLNRKYLMYDFDYESVREIDQPDATCFMIRSDVMGILGGFDERFSILYNDVDLCQRMKKLGLKIFFIPHASITHRGSQSTHQAPPRLRLEMYQNILLYYHQYAGPASWWLLTPVLVIRFLIVTRSALFIQLMKPLEAARSDD